MSLRQLRQDVFQANAMLVENGLAVLALGNASGIDRELGLVVIKPSGANYQDMDPDAMSVVTLDGDVVDGDMRPSSDTATHLALYRAWPGLGGITHSHSSYATAFAQAGKAIPCFGVTHAGFCPGDIPCVVGSPRTDAERENGSYSGRAIIEHYKAGHLEPLLFPAAVVRHHGPFAWGRNPVEAANNALLVENIAKTAIYSMFVEPALASLSAVMVDHLHHRSHGQFARN